MTQISSQAVYLT